MRGNAGQKLSVCLITKNEAENLPDCLSSVKTIADQIVVADTGSTDSTVKVARSFGAEVFHFDWCDDFSAARNFSITKAAGDWILWLDADERIFPESLAAVRDLLRPEKKAVIYQVHIRNRMRAGNYEYWSTAHRLFNNQRGIRFSGAVHEQVSPSVAALNGEERNSAVQIDHLGYGFSEEQMTEKFARNEKLLATVVEKEPDNAYAHYTLAQNYGLQKKLQLAVQHYCKALALNQLNDTMKASLLNSLGDVYRQLDILDKVNEVAGKSLSLVPDQVAGHFLSYKVAEARGDFPAMIAELTQIRAINQRLKGKPKQLSSDVQLDDNLILSTMYQTFRQGGYTEEACNCITEILGKNVNADFAEALIVKAAGFNDFEALEKIYEWLYYRSPKQIDIARQLATIYIKNRKFDQAITLYEKLVDLIPENRDAIRMLAGLYGKVGAQEQAVNLLTRIAGK